MQQHLLLICTARSLSHCINPFDISTMCGNHNLNSCRLSHTHYFPESHYTTTLQVKVPHPHFDISLSYVHRTTCVGIPSNHIPLPSIQHASSPPDSQFTFGFSHATPSLQCHPLYHPTTILSILSVSFCETFWPFPFRLTTFAYPMGRLSHAIVPCVSHHGAD